MNLLSNNFLEKYKNSNPPFGPVGYVTYKRTYARRIESENRTEEWWETCRRELEEIHKLGCPFTKEEAEEFYDDLFNIRCSFSGRAKWQLGTKTVEKIGGASLNACWGVVVDNWKAFVFTFDHLMLGAGVGYNIQKEYVYQLPKVKKNVTISRKDTNDADFIVPDSREGWIELLDRVFVSWFETGKSFTYSTVCVRGKDVPIKGFGGVSSGPEELCKGIADISKILESRQSKKVRPIDCLDIMNIIGRIVVSGNVRRSAQLALGDPDDFQFLKAKRWDLGIPNWRSNSNNSVVCNDINLLPEEFWKSFYKDSKTGRSLGEAYGLINLKLARERGRVLDCHRKDPDCSIGNPCGEILLSPPPDTGEGESCNLFEIFIARIPDKNSFIRIAKYAYRVVKTISQQKYHWKESDKVIKKNSRLGISLTGICEWLPNMNKEEAANWLDSCYKELEQEDKTFSKKMGYKESIKLTTVKPSGTLSLLTNSSPGVHPFYSRFYIRRIRFASNDPLISVLKENGYPMEFKKEFDGSYDSNTIVVDFPVRVPNSAIVAKDLSAIDQLELVKFMNTYWSDNSTSVTVYYKEEELPEIRNWLETNYNKHIKSVSFLKHSEHGFLQAPYEEISEEQYNEISSYIRKFENKIDIGGDDIEHEDCKNGSCAIK